MVLDECLRDYQNARRTQSNEAAKQPGAKSREVMLQMIVGYNCTH